MDQNLIIYGKNEYAVLHADFAVIMCVLQDYKNWNSQVMEWSGETHWKVKLLRAYTWGLNSPRIIPLTVERFIAHGFIGKNAHIAYQIEKLDEKRIKIIPIEFIPNHKKIFTSIYLSLFFFVPILLSPIYWKIYKVRTYRSSKLHLNSLCLFLKNALE